MIEKQVFRNLGYSLYNMEWVTMSENSRRDSISKTRKLKGITP